MSYDWKKIFKNKTDKELFQIYLGETHLDSEARNYAEEELKKRNFDFNNIGKQKMKWELEELIKADKVNYTFFISRDFRSRDFLLMGIFGSFFIFLNILNEFINIFDLQGLSERILFIFVSVSMTTIGFIGYRINKRKEKNRKSRIKELIEQL